MAFFLTYWNLGILRTTCFAWPSPKTTDSPPLSPCRLGDSPDWWPPSTLGSNRLPRLTTAMMTTAAALRVNMTRHGQTQVCPTPIHSFRAFQVKLNNFSTNQQTLIFFFCFVPLRSVAFRKCNGNGILKKIEISFDSLINLFYYFKPFFFN